MRKHSIIWLFLSALIGASLMLTYSCSKRNEVISSHPTSQVPIVTTDIVSEITQTIATTGGNVSLPEGSSPVTNRGVCWSISANPTISGLHSTNGTGTGKFRRTITGLSPNTPYFVRAYATNSAGTSYGYEVGFITLQVVSQVPLVNTGEVNNITQISAIGGGNVDSQGSSPVTGRGLCWSTTPNPTLLNAHSRDSSGTGDFVSNLTGLYAGVQYFVRAYATNSTGDSYGNQVTFTTLKFSIGQYWGGGIIFYIDSTHTHGLIASNGYTGDQKAWGCWANSVPGTSTAICTGKVNTSYIVDMCGTNTAAMTCVNYTAGGCDDWFLPSMDEMYQMYLHKNIIGDFTANYYWTSSQYDRYDGIVVSFINGFKTHKSKDSNYYVRPIRAF